MNGNEERKEHQITAGDKKRVLKRMLGRQGVLVLSSMALLAAAMIYMTVAWYTRTVNVSNATFDIAQWDFSADHNVGDFIINVYEYSNMNAQKAGPGTSGVIPIQLSALLSDTDVDYQLSFTIIGIEENEPGSGGEDTETPGEGSEANIVEELQKRIKFYYYKDETTEKTEENRTYLTDDVYFTGTITRGTAQVKELYWEWIYEVPVPFENGEQVRIDNTGQVTATAAGRTEVIPVRPGVIKADEVGKTYDKYTDLSDGLRDAILTSDVAEGFRSYRDITDENNEFDTMIGRNPMKYEKYMSVEIQISGTQVVPELVEPETPDTPTTPDTP